MEHLEGILKITDAELGAITTNGKYRSREEIDAVYKLMDIAKDVYCIWEYEESGEDEMSFDGGSYRGGSYRGGSYNNGGSYGRSYEGGSYARGRGRGARRDSMGRYSREGRSYRSGARGYSRDGGEEDYIENLREMMESAPDDNTRQSIQRMIQQMENQQ